ncbi:MAG: isoaspartyl peptidase/L-asparaginase [Polyangiaceae bacterium]
MNDDDDTIATFSGSPSRWSLIVHGGAGLIPDEQKPLHEEGCRKVAERVGKALAEGASALLAVQMAVESLEDDPVYNAATGGALTQTGDLELDAAIMDGASLGAGAVCALPPFKNPIAIAKRILEVGEHVLYAGEGAAAFARSHGFMPASAEDMITSRAREKWKAHLERREKGATKRGESGGTVGAVAYDLQGHVAAATSTGGTTGKAKGRVGDSPLIGAGTYADDERGAASATGDGEAFIKLCAAKTTCDLLSGGLPPGEAAKEVLLRVLTRAFGRGGIIVVGHDGTLGFARSSPCMAFAAVSDTLALTSGC